jgi:hypothetical protein
MFSRSRKASKRVFASGKWFGTSFREKIAFFREKSRFLRKKTRFSAIFAVQKRSAVPISAAISISAFFY